MASKPRHLKTPLQLWLIDNRKRLSMEPADLAQLTGVTEATVRGWESRGRPSEDALAVLERRFGVAAPRGEQVVGDQSAVAAAIDRQTAALSAFVQELRAARKSDEVRLRALEVAVALLAQRGDVELPDPIAPRA